MSQLCSAAPAARAPAMLPGPLNPAPQTEKQPPHRPPGPPGAGPGAAMKLQPSSAQHKPDTAPHTRELAAAQFGSWQQPKDKQRAGQKVSGQWLGSAGRGSPLFQAVCHAWPLCSPAEWGASPVQPGSWVLVKNTGANLGAVAIVTCALVRALDGMGGGHHHCTRLTG